MNTLSSAIETLKQFVGADYENELESFLSEGSAMLASLEAWLSAAEPGELPPNIDDVLRNAHTLKGICAQIGLSGISLLVHRLEDNLVQMRENKAAATEPLLTLSLETVDRLKTLFAAITRGDESVTLEAPDLVERLEAIASGRSTAPASAQETGKPDSGELTEELASIEVPLRLLDQLFDQLGAMPQGPEVNDALWTLVTARMLPPASLVTRMRRLVRETAPKVGKKVKLTVSGETEPIDVSIVRELGEMLMHMVRNSLDHGIETPEERERTGKTPEANLSIKFVKSPEMVMVQLEDDGRGIDVNRIAAKAIEKGIITADQNDLLTNYERLRLIFAPGFSTAAQVTELSGRGVGMDVVLTSSARLGGKVEIETEVGKHTRFTIKFPVRFYCIPSVIARISDQSFAINSDAIERVLTDPSLFRLDNGAAVLTEHPDELVPLIGFPAIDAKLWDSKRMALVLFNFEGTRVGLCVDELVDARSIILAPLPPGVAQPYLNSAAMDPDLGVVFGLNVDEVKRNWNSYMIPEKEPSPMSPRQTLMQNIQEVLSENQLSGNLNELLREIKDPEIVQQALEYCTQQRSEFLCVVDDVGEGEDLDYVLATRYLQQKAHWIQFNIQMQYQSILKGEADPLLLCKSSIISFLLGQIEPLIDPVYVTAINQMLTEPMQKSA